MLSAKMNRAKLVQDFDATLEQISMSVELFYQGKHSFYQTIAVQLRKLLTKEDPLLRKIFTSTALHPLKSSILNGVPASMRQGLVFVSPATISFDGKGGARITHLFDTTQTPISLEQWLDQPLLQGKITIRELINSVADKEGAHADSNYNDTLSVGHSIHLADNNPIHSHYIVAIGEYVYESLTLIRSTFEEELAKWKNN